MRQYFQRGMSAKTGEAVTLMCDTQAHKPVELGMPRAAQDGLLPIEIEQVRGFFARFDLL
jgi:hypothetical protein